MNNEELLEEAQNKYLEAKKNRDYYFDLTKSMEKTFNKPNDVTLLNQENSKKELEDAIMILGIVKRYCSSDSGYISQTDLANALFVHPYRKNTANI